MQRPSARNSDRLDRHPSPARRLATVTAVPRSSTFDAKLVARCVLAMQDNIQREVPYDAQSVKIPRDVYVAQHPTFKTSVDWHASVINHWALLRAADLDPSAASTRQTIALLDDHFAPEKLAIEAKNIANQLPEIPYGLGWALRLAAELKRSPLPQAKQWAKNFEPLEKAAVRKLRTWLGSLTELNHIPVHFNSAFSIGQAIDYADAVGNTALGAELRAAAVKLAPPPTRAWNGDGAYGAGFIAPYLAVADMLRRALPPREFATYFAEAQKHYFLGEKNPQWLHPFFPDESEPWDPDYINHFVGLAFYKAAVMRSIAGALPPGNLRDTLIRSADEHARGGKEHLAQVLDQFDALGVRGNYALTEAQLAAFWPVYNYTHWLGGYAMYEQTAVPSSIADRSAVKK